jgi:hypothetical protein
MVPDTASRPSMSAVQTVSPEDEASAERWRQWQLRNVVTSRKDAKRARIAFTVLFAGLAPGSDYSCWLRRSGRDTGGGVTLRIDAAGLS